jgi:hypothetical protein
VTSSEKLTAAPTHVTVATHGHCFDGLASAVIFTKLLRHIKAGHDLSFKYLAMGYGAGAGPDFDALLDGDENAILDYKFSRSSKLTWYFDHHVSAFTSDAERKAFEESRGNGRFFHDGTYGSCTKFLVDIGAKFFDFNPEPLGDLVYWADIIDRAAFPSAAIAVARQEPALRLMTLIEQSGEAELISRFVPALTDRPLDDVANDPEVVASYTQWQATAAPYEARVKAHAKLVGGAIGAVLVDLTDELSDAAPKFVTYALYPDSAYSVVVTRGLKKIKLSIGFNPWCGQTRKHDIAKICERHGGGGHPVVGAIALPPGDVARAQELARAIADELART